MVGRMTAPNALLFNKRFRGGDKWKISSQRILLGTLVAFSLLLSLTISSMHSFYSSSPGALLLSHPVFATVDPRFSALTEKNQDLIQASARHVQDLMERARRQRARFLRHPDTRDDVIYAKRASPLLGFLIPKTGSNTLLYYLSVALAVVGKFANQGCQPPNRAGCLMQPSQIVNTSCHDAFYNHFEPIPLVDALVAAEQQVTAGADSSTTTCRRWPDNPLPSVSETSTRTTPGGIYKEVLQRSVCIITLRDPIDRAIASFYEWHYQKTSQLTAIAYLDEHGPQAFLDLVGGAYQKEYTTPAVWENVLESCLVGVTEQMDDFVTILSRILKIAPPTADDKAVHFRTHYKPGMNAAAVERFYHLLTPLMHDDINLWRLATRVAAAQFNVAKAFRPIVRLDLTSTAFGNTCYFCETCAQPGDPWMGIQWKVFDRPAGKPSVGYPFDKQACCRRCPTKT